MRNGGQSRPTSVERRSVMETKNMKVWTSDSFQGVYPVGVAAVVVAATAEEAAEALKNSILYPESVKAEDMQELPLINGRCRVICDGDY